jgi:mono/diheme cytochrome c family protein
MSSTRIFLAAIGAGILAVGAAFGLAKAWPHQKTVAPLPAPVDKAALVATGKSYFSMSCAHCHADDATGDEGPNLHKLDISDAHVTLILKNGIKGEMPNFSKKYDDAQMAAIIAFLRTLD